MTLINDGASPEQNAGQENHAKKQIGREFIMDFLNWMENDNIINVAPRIWEYSKDGLQHLTAEQLCELFYKVNYSNEVKK